MPQKQPSYSPTPTQATQGPGGGAGEPKSMAGAPGAQNMMGGLLGGSRQGNVTPASVKGFMPSGGGGLLGGLMGATRYTSIRDMFNGGGPGRSGEQFYGGGMLSAGLNRAGVRPAGYQGLMAAMASQAARKASQPGYTPTGYGTAPTGGLGAPAGAPAASGGLGAPAGAPAGGPVANRGAPILGSGMTPTNAYAPVPVAPMTYGPQTRPNVTPGLSYGPQARYANYRAPQLAQTQVQGFPSTPPLVAVPGQYFPQFPGTAGMGRVPPGQPYTPGPERSWTYGQPAEAYREMMVNRYLPVNTSTVPVPRGAGALAQPYLPAVTR